MSDRPAIRHIQPQVVPVVLSILWLFAGSLLRKALCALENGYWHLKFERFSRNRNPRAVSEPIIISLEVITLMKLNRKL